MNVAAAGTGPPSAPETFAGTLPEVARVRTPGHAEDHISHSLEGLAGPQTAELLARLEQARDNHDPQLFEGLLKTAVAAVGAHRIHEALSAISEMAKLHPEHAAQLVRREAGLASIRGEVDQLFGRLTMGARAEAVQMLAAAATVIPAGDAAAANIREACERFLESGTYINYVRAAELGGMLLTAYAPAKTPRSLDLRRLGAMWRRVPVLVLLVGWFLIGLIGGIISLAGRTVAAGPVSAGPFEVWVGGFLALVGFQFVATVWSSRFRP